MESITRNVRDIESGDRQALEHVVGQALQDDQKLIIQIVTLDSCQPPTDTSVGELPDWCNVYAGLSDEAIAEIEKIALTRADLARPSE